MPNAHVDDRIAGELAVLRQTRQYKQLHYLAGAMGPVVEIEGRGEVVMLCSNDYLGLANHPEVVAAGIEGLHRYGAGTASVRFITGTLACHREIEHALGELSATQAALTYVSAWAANEALFPTVVAKGEVIFSDALNHASIIDSCRQVQGAQRVVYPHGDLDYLERSLGEHANAPARWVVTDGVFSMEGELADLPRLVNLCEEYKAMLVVDDSHGVGVLGAHGRGTAEHFDVLGRVDVVTGTLGKALGGGAGGYVAASSAMVDLLVQRSRPSLFSNALPATVACSSRRAIEVLQAEPQRVERLRANVVALRDGLARLGFECTPSSGTISPSAIIPIIIGDTAEAIAKSRRLLELGVAVIGFGFPVVPKGAARLRVQASAALEPHHIATALNAFAQL